MSGSLVHLWHLFIGASITSTGLLVCSARAGSCAPDDVALDPRVTSIPGLPHGPFVRLSDGGIMGVDENNAIVTHDDGKTWVKHPIFKPGAAFKVRPERALLRTRSGAIILIFANDAVLKYSWDKEKNLPKPDMRLPSYSIRSLDEGKTWQDLNLLHDGWCGCIQDILQTSTGNVVVPGQELLYKEGRHATVPYVSTDDGKTWQRTRYLDIGGQGDHAGAIEGTLEELRDGRLWMLLRSYAGFFYESLSSDHGLTWTDPKPSAIKSTGSPGKMKRLASGRLVLLWNAIPNEGYVRREELSISLSEDDGKTWTPPQVFARNKGGRVSYPHLFEHSPGELWITTMQGSLRASLKEADFLKDWTKIVAFGDSTTAPRGDLPTYADLLQKELPGKGVDAWVLNAGVGGNSTEDARKRFERDVLDHKPQVAIIQFGVNDSAIDVWKDPPATAPRVALARYRENLEYFVDMLQKQTARVILMTPNPLRWTDKTKAMYGKPPYKPDDPTGFNVLLLGYAEAVRQVAREKQVGLIDLYARYEVYDEQEGQSMDDLLLDGMHPNERGHRLAADLLLAQIAAPVGD
jgi:lysophospholipase L1-like esterase